MARTFDITPLRSLVAVASTGGVHRAAQSLLVTQSAVSQHLRKLEREAGTTLVTRDGRRLAFTPDGEELLAHARAILAAHDAAVTRFDKQSHTVLSVGTAANSAAVVLPSLMASLRESLPDNEVRFHLDRNATVRQMLADAQVHIAVTTRVAHELAARDDGLRLRWLWSSSVEPPAVDAEISLTVFAPPCTLRQPSFDAWSSTGRSWRVHAEVNDLATGLDTVRAGTAAMLVPVLDRLPDGVRELPHAPLPPALQMAVVYTDRTPAPLRDAVHTALSEVVGPERVETVRNEALAMP